MTFYQAIQSKLEVSLTPSFLTIENESHKHSVPVDSETHFKVIIVSSSFDKKSPVQRHQLVYALLAHEFQSGLHALALHTYTPQEWTSVEKTVDSPGCMSGG
ncbi:MAG: BolA protein [Porticoccus sp.]|jgi:BolA protein